MNIITCPSCGKKFEIEEALKQQIKDQILAQERVKYEQELSQVREKLKKTEESELIVRKLKNQLEEEKRSLELTIQRRVDEESNKIRQSTTAEVLESQKLRLKELEKKNEDLRKSLDEAQRKATQTSQQLQGEVLELDLEETLKLSFPQDIIEPIGKGILGADIRQVVRSPRGIVCGTILWESKRTKAWSDGWLDKLKQDLRTDKANLPAIVSETLPAEIKNGLGLIDGVWVSAPKLVLPLAMLLRKALLDVARQKVVDKHSQTKAEQIYCYITSHEFSQQVEAMIEAYLEMKQQINKERTAFEKSWKQRESQVNRLLSGVAGIYGSMQGIAGPALPPIRQLELESGED